MHKIPGDHNKKETKVEIGGRSPFAVSDDTAVSDILEVCRASLSRLILQQSHALQQVTPHAQRGAILLCRYVQFQ